MNRFWLGLLVLTWKTFRSVEGARGGCPSPPVAEFAEFFAESYQVGTRVNYECDKGYKRPAGQGRVIKCNSDSDGFGQWTSVTCIVDPILSLHPSTQPEAHFGEESGRTDEPLTTAPPHMKGFCGVLRPSKHVKAVSMTYTIGQELQYRCMDGYQARSPIFEKSTCQNSNGKAAWSNLHLQCTNDTMSIEEDTMSIEEDVTPGIGTSDVSTWEADTSPTTVPGGFATVIYPASDENSKHLTMFSLYFFMYLGTLSVSKWILPLRYVLAAVFVIAVMAAVVIG